MARIVIIGAGAAGCFCAVLLKRRFPQVQVLLLEAGPEPMKKLSLTGGGRCNITNSFEHVRSVDEAYPRGAALMRRVLRAFGPDQTISWFEAEGVRFTLQEDGCYFPLSQDASQIVRTLSRAMARSGVELRCRSAVRRVDALPGGGFRICGDLFTVDAGQVVVTAGGSVRRGFLSFLDPLGLEQVPPVPSLFTFNVGESALRALSGTVAGKVKLSIPGTRFSASGILLLTHWGFSGPAALKLSSCAARWLSEALYCTPLRVNWLDISQQDCRSALETLQGAHPLKTCANARIEALPHRLWEALLGYAGIGLHLRWKDLPQPALNRLVLTLTDFPCAMAGKYPHREEFVTCGGVALSEISPRTLGSKRFPSLFFAGEVLDIDAITGGFNLQAAWSTAQTVAMSLKID
ncbi:MAG: aminoacetone oxidase family FAD-binding enzyme [Bacteroidales bacterium]|nr:aminoacetone oxidase family FAD-binding enzyme [Bacteroidales bacterium]